MRRVTGNLAVLGPYLAGVMITARWEHSMYFFALSVPLIAALIIVLRLRISSTS